MKKYKISHELMNDINEWRDSVHGLIVSADLILPLSIYGWWLDNDQGVSEKNNRLIALIQYVNGEDVFEVEKPKKWIVQSKHLANGHRYYVSLKNSDLVSAIEIGTAHFASLTTDIDFAFRFNTKEEAEQFSNPLMEAVEVDDD